MDARMTEEDVKARFITPAITQSGWATNQVWMEYQITQGQIIVQGTNTRRGPQGRADYMLASKKTGKPLAVVEAKDFSHTTDAGLQQALRYASQLDAPFAYSSNGKGFVEHDFLTGTERKLSMDEFPSEDELWKHYVAGKELDDAGERLVEEPYYFDSFSKKKPRYYQRIAIDRTLEAIARGQKRLLLVMATGTGKTFTSFQIIWRLLKAKAVRRVLYLADRNVLIDQTIQNDFSPLSDKIVKVRNKHLDSAFEVYMSLYHQLDGDIGTEAFRQFKPEFFDLVIVDECHRGSAREDSQWRRILDYFSDAIQIGMTATPKETEYASNITYFGEPVYTYSLKQGIEDGFLAPYKVLRVGLNVDLENWRPSKGQRDANGNEIEDREYNVKDFDRNLVIDERTQIVAKYMASWLRQHGTDSKTIVFCIDIEHAERMRLALINELPDKIAEDWRYIMCITGDNEEGKAQLDNFSDPDEPYPTIATTSKLLTTGVDVKTLKLIVLESNISSMTEFKQIIGRGTRLEEENGKKFFTIMDFRGSTRHFADPEFDGEPVASMSVLPPTISEDGVLELPEWSEGNADNSADFGEDRNTSPTVSSLGTELNKDKVRVRGVDVHLLNDRVQYIDPSTGKLITENIRDFTRMSLLGTYADLSTFLQAWNEADRKSVLLSELTAQGVFIDAIRAEAGGTLDDVDDFDVIMHVAFDAPPLTKRERAEKVKKRGYLHEYSSECENVLSALLDKYADVGISELEDIQVLSNEPFVRYGSAAKIINLFGGKDKYLQAVKGLEEALYQTVA